MNIFICGDSTAASYKPENAPMTGWGQVLGEMLENVTIVNRAMAGRSTKSYLADGRLTAIEKELQPGDLLLIQFAHNDGSDLVWRHTDANTSFVANLAIFVDTARLRGAIPVLLTPIPRREWREGVLVDLHGEYAPAIRRLALMRGVPLADVTALGMQALQEMGEEATQGLFMNVPPEVYPAYPRGAKDNTHTQREGALLFARIVAGELRRLGLV